VDLSSLSLVPWGPRIVLGSIVLSWAGAWGKTIRLKTRPRWFLTADLEPGDPATLVSVVIPARDEARNLGACLDGVLAQDHPALQVVVIDDGSSDETGAILADYAARDARIVAVSGDGALPEGWFGKPWALHRAQARADGEWLLFIDADVRLEPGAVSRALGYAAREEQEMLTGFGNLVLESFWERVLQPAIGGLVLAANDLDVINDPTVEGRDIANGQFIFISREAYDAVGGHEAVRANILDDIGLARALSEHALPYRCLYLLRLFRCRMYTGLGEIWEGWSKNLFASMDYSWGWLSYAVFLTIMASQVGPAILALSLAGVIGGEWAIWGAIIMVQMHAVRLAVDWIFEQPKRYAITHVPANFLMILLMVHSGLKGSFGRVSWKGREYDLGG